MSTIASEQLDSYDAYAGEVQGDIVPGFRIGRSRPESQPEFHRAFLFGRFGANIDDARRDLATLAARVTWASDLLGHMADGPFCSLALSWGGLRKLDEAMAESAAAYSRAPRRGPRRRPFQQGPTDALAHLACDPAIDVTDATLDLVVSVASFAEDTFQRSLKKVRALTGIEWDPRLQFRGAASPRPLGFRDVNPGAPVVHGFHGRPPSQGTGGPAGPVAVVPARLPRPPRYDAEREQGVGRLRPAYPSANRTATNSRLVLPREQVLVDPADQLANGSFLAFLSFALDPDRLDAFAADLAPRLQQTWPSSRPPTGFARYAKAAMLGRDVENGRSVLFRAKAAGPTPVEETSEEAFTYHAVRSQAGAAGVRGPAVVDQDGAVCPLGAHVRKMNPRLGGAWADHAIVRRGVASSDGKALYFAAYQSDLSYGIETLATWADTRTLPETHGSADPLISRSSQTGSAEAVLMIPAPEDVRSRTKPSFPARVKNDWARVTFAFYGFAPSRSMLTALSCPRPEPPVG